MRLAVELALGVVLVDDAVVQSGLGLGPGRTSWRFRFRSFHCSLRLEGKFEGDLGRLL